MDEEYSYSKQKDALLKKQRGIGFGGIILHLENGGLVKTTSHHNQQHYAGQLLYHVEIEGYIWLVAGEIRGKTVYLITAYPSRKATKKTKKGKNHEEEIN